MVKHKVRVNCHECDYSWLYGGKAWYPEHVLCPNCYEYTALPEKAQEQEIRVI